MKRYSMYGLLCLLILFSCQPDDTASILSPAGPIDVPIANSVVDDNDQWIHAGFGYHFGRDKPFKSAIVGGDVSESTIIGGFASKAEITIVDSQKKIDSLFSKTKKRSGGFGIWFIRVGGSKTRSILEQTTIDERNLSVVAKVELRRFRYDVNTDLPTLTPEAQDLVDAGDASGFFSNYGPTYVDTNVKGGEVYYVYNFDREKLAKLSDRSKGGSLKLGFEYYFNVSIGASGSERKYTYSEMSEAITSASVYSTIPNYSGQVVRSVEDFNAELVRLEEHLSDRPENANSVEMRLMPYTAFIRSEPFLAREQDLDACYDNYREWEKVQDRLIYIEMKSGNEALREDARLALREVEDGLTLAGNCVATSDPFPQFQDILDRMDQEERRYDLLARTVPLYRFYSAERTNSYYTTDPETVKSIDGGSSYEPRGVLCRIFDERDAEGMIWLKEYWYNEGDDHRYDSEELRDLGEDSNYRFGRDLGYLYRNNGVNGTDDEYLQQIYIFYNEETRDHLLTTDPQQESFGSAEGGDGYRPVGTLGFGIKD